MDDFEDADLMDSTNAFFNTFLENPDEPKVPSDKEGDDKPPVRKPAPKAEVTEPEEEEVETEDEETPSEDDETEEGDEEEKEEKAYAEDAAYVKIKVGDEVQEVPVRDLTRLYGQESALTKRSQEVADTRKKLELDQATHIAAANVQLEAARKRYEPYAKIDFLSLARNQNVSEQEYNGLRAEAQARYEELQFLEHSTGEYMQKIQERQTESFKAQALESVKQLTDAASPNYIENWNQETYTSLRKFAVDQGVPVEMVNQIIAAPVIKLLHMAQMYEKGKAAKVQSVKVNKTVKKVIKSSRQAPDSVKTGKGDKGKSFDRLKRSGSQEDATNAFMSRFADYGDIE